MRVVSFDVGTVNFALCILETDSERTCYPLTIEHWELIHVGRDTQEATDAASVAMGTHYNDLKSIDHAVALLTCALLRRQHLFQGGDTVLIENQNAATDMMKRLSAAIQTFFVTLNWDMYHREHPSIVGQQHFMTIRYCHAIAKLGVVVRHQKNDGDTEPPKPKTRKRKRKDDATSSVAGAVATTKKEKPLRSTSSYASNKRQARDTCLSILEYGVAQGWSDFERARDSVWARHAKKDDLADSFLQALYFLQKHRA